MLPNLFSPGNGETEYKSSAQVSGDSQCRNMSEYEGSAEAGMQIMELSRLGLVEAKLDERFDRAVYTTTPSGKQWLSRHKLSTFSKFTGFFFQRPRRGDPESVRRMWLTLCCSRRFAVTFDETGVLELIDLKSIEED